MAEIFHGGSGKKSIFDSQRVVSDCRSAGWQPGFSVHDTGLLAGYSQRIVLANCDE
jgi:hypothetical protein